MTRFLLVKLISVFVFVLCVVSCSKQENSQPIVLISSNASSINADGVSVAAFSVRYSGEGDIDNMEDITESIDVEIFQEGVGKLPGKEFSTLVPGQYKFVAQYKGIRSTPIEVTAELVASSFLRNRVVLFLTSTGCSACPKGSVEVQQARAAYPDKLYPLYFHTLFSTPTDPFVTPSTSWFGQWMATNSLPTIYLDNMEHLFNNSFSASSFNKYFDPTQNLIKSHSGFRVESRFDSTTRKLWCRVSVRVMDKRYQVDKVHLVGWITEDKLIAEQRLLTGGTNTKYEHQDVVRKGLYGNAYSGHLLGKKYLGSGVEFNDTLELIIPEAWNADNSNLTFYLYHDTGGGRLKDTLINSIRVPVGKVQEYQVLE